MKIDELGCLVMEGSSPEGNLGDSCAETARLFLLNKNNPYFLDLQRFRTMKGYVRHPNAIWREDDFSSDQALPLFLAMNPYLSHEMFLRIVEAGYKTGNGTYVSPGFYALLKGNQWLINMTLWIQTLIFKFPWRWSDERKWFEKSEGSSGDYLNWIHASQYAFPWVRNLIKKETLKQKVRDYYKPEPNSAWLINLYDEFINEHFPL